MQTLAVIDEVCANALHTANIDVLKTKPVVSFYAPDEGGGKISGWFAMKNAFDFHPSDQPFVSGATLGNRWPRLASVVLWFIMFLLTT